jgi:hypothetical protein
VSVDPVQTTAEANKRNKFTNIIDGFYD